MTSSGKTATGKRVLVVEDELMIRMLLEGMLTDLGYTMAAEAGGIEEALNLAREAAFDVAVLDVNLNGKPITPGVEVLVARGLPFVFARGYGRRGVPGPSTRCSIWSPSCRRRPSAATAMPLICSARQSGKLTLTRTPSRTPSASTLRMMSG